VRKGSSGFEGRVDIVSFKRFEGDDGRVDLRVKFMSNLTDVAY